jgi:phosphatidate cytidylyltransferase
MLRWRLLAAAAILGPLLLLIWLDDRHHGGRPGIWLGPLAVLVSGLAADEINGMLSRAGIAVSRWANVSAVVLVTVCSLIPLVWREFPAGSPGGKTVWTLLGVALALGGLFTAELFRYRQPGESIQRLAGGCLAVVYVGMLAGFWVQIRLISPSRLGLAALFSTILVVKLADTGAYFVGRAIGRTKLTRISPGKTVEGVIGGLAFAVLGAWLTRDVLLPRLVPDHVPGPLLCYALYAATLTLVGLIGDLSESLLKRDAGVKDSSAWLPGLGGVLDVVDSLLAVAPLSYLWWTSGGL